jgi:uncharacterized membrane protein YdjX (TVP38/TMEM64 family)
MSRRNLIRLLVFVLLAAAVGWAIAYRDEFTVAALRARLDGFGVLAPLVFVAAYAVGTVLFLPGSVFTIAGGVLFGPWEGTALSLAGATVGATVAFFAARYLASDWVARRAAGRLRRLIQGVEREGWRFVAFVRLVPVFPFNLLNYALGLTRIPWVQYVAASAVCMAPGAFAYTWIGHAGAKAVAGGQGTIQAVLIALGVFAAVAFLPRLIRRFKQDDAREEGV